MAGKKGQKKRFWSDEEKAAICVQTCTPGVSVSQVAQRYAMNANLIHNWLRDPQYVPDLEVVEERAAETPCFLPVKIVDRSVAHGTGFVAQRALWIHLLNLG